MASCFKDEENMCMSSSPEIILDGDNDNSDSSLQMPPSSTHPLGEFNANNRPAGITTVKNDMQVNLSNRPFRWMEITAVAG